MDTFAAFQTLKWEAFSAIVRLDVVIPFVQNEVAQAQLVELRDRLIAARDKAEAEAFPTLASLVS